MSTSVTRLWRRPARIGRWLAALGLGLVFAVGSGLVNPTAAQAYRTFVQLCGGGKWNGNSAGVYIAAATVPSGWTSAISASRSQWNGISGSAFSYSAPVRVSGPIPPPGARGVGIRHYNIHSSDGIPLSVPAWTSNLEPLSLNHGVAYVNLSNQWTWNLTGAFSQTNRRADVRTVVTHELGHANGIAHPWQATCSGGTRSRSSTC